MKLYISDWHNNFFDSIYSFVKKENRSGLASTVLVLATTRAKHIALEKFQAEERNTLLPEIFTVEEFLSLCQEGYLDGKFASSRAIDTLESIALLYEIISNLAKKEEDDFYKNMLEFEQETGLIKKQALENFQHFYSYGEYLNAIIQECFNEHSLAISLPHVGDEVDGFAQYLLKNLREIINSYKNILDSRSLHTSAYMRYCLAQKLLHSDAKSIFGDKEIYFCGLDRITNAEEVCFNYFKKFSTYFLFSSDKKLVTDRQSAHWCTSFYQDYCDKWNAEFVLIDEDTTEVQSQEFFFHQAFDMHSQFQHFSIEDASLSNACILNNPNSLLPLLHSLNPYYEDEELNVTMGYPLSESKVFQLFNTLSSFRERARVYLDSENKEQIYISYPDFIDFISFPFFNISLSHVKQEFQEARGGDALPFINILDIPEVFSANKSLADAIARTLPLLLDWYKLTSLENVVNFMLKLEKILENANLQALDKVALKRLHEKLFLCRQKPRILVLNLGYDLCVKLFLEMIKDESIAFEHHSNKAIQILGLRETRLLSFDTIHIFDSNDEYLPPRFDENPLLPDNLRAHLGLKSVKMYELYTAHTWHRLLASAKTVHLYWHESTAKGLLDTKKTRSPYVEEALWELERQKGMILEANEKEFTQAKCIIELPQRELSVPVTDTIREAMLDFCKKSISPTSLDTFLSCPLKFFYQYILKVKAVEEPKEEDNQRVIGNVVHNFMEALYPEEGALVDKEQLKQRYKQEICQLDTYFDKEHLYDIMPAESMLLLKNSFPHKMKKFIEQQPEQTKIVAKEKKLEALISLKEKNINTSIDVKLHGVIDRIDERTSFSGDTKNIILDYKTGSLTSKKSNKTFWTNNDLFCEIEENLQNYTEEMAKILHISLLNGIKSLQLPFYIFLTNKNNYSILNAAYVDFYDTCSEISMISEDSDAEKIIDTQIPLILEFLVQYMQCISVFTRTSKAQCVYCNYKKYCG